MRSLNTERTQAKDGNAVEPHLSYFYSLSSICTQRTENTTECIKIIKTPNQSLHLTATRSVRSLVHSFSAPFFCAQPQPLAAAVLSFIVDMA